MKARYALFGLFLFLGHFTQAQIETIEFEDGTEIQFGLYDDMPQIGPKLWIYGALSYFSFPSNEEVAFTASLRANYQLNNKIQLSGDFSIDPLQSSFNLFQLGGHYLLHSSMGKSRSRIPLKAKDLGARQVTYFLKRKVQSHTSWNAYLGYGRRNSQSSLRLLQTDLNTIVDSTFAATHRSMRVNSLTINSLDIGLSYSYTKNYKYLADDYDLSTFSRIRSTAKIMIPLNRSVMGELEIFNDKASDQQRNDLMDSFWNPVGFSIDTDLILSRNLSKSSKKWVQTVIGLDFGVFPFLESESFFVRVSMGYGWMD